MKIWRLVSGILSMISFLIITFQSCAVGFVNAIEELRAKKEDIKISDLIKEILKKRI